MNRTPMLRKLFSVALLGALVGLVGMTRDAGATVTFDLIWTATSGAGPGLGTSSITAAVGDTLTLSLRMTTDEEICLHAVSIAFDTDLGNELNLMGSGEWSGTNYGTVTMQTNYSPITAGVGPPPPVESQTGGPAGQITLIESGQIFGPLFLPVGTYTVGTAAFQVNTVSADGPDVFVGLFGAGDTVIGLGFVPVTSLVFNSATVNIPEPGTASLLGLCLVGLALAVRHRRRS